MGIDRGVTCRTGQVLAVTVWNMLTRLRVSESLSQAKVDYINIMLLLPDANQEIVRLNIPVQEVSGVDELNPLKLKRRLIAWKNLPSGLQASALSLGRTCACSNWTSLRVRVPVGQSPWRCSHPQRRTNGHSEFRLHFCQRLFDLKAVADANRNTYLLLARCGRALFHKVVVGAWFSQVPTKKVTVSLLWLKIKVGFSCWNLSQTVGCLQPTQFWLAANSWSLLTNLIATSSFVLMLVPW